MERFLETLRVQRWDDHRYYHHSRINQSLHLVSAISFLFAYVMIFKDPAIAALVGWLVAMTSRQIGHFFFEPKDYDAVNQASHEHKEEIKVGYNLQRKVVLLTIWALSPLPLFVDPTLFGIFTPHAERGRARAPCRADLARHRPRRSVVSDGPVVLHQGRPDRIGMGDQDPHRPLPRHQALLQGAALSAARRADRSKSRPKRDTTGTRRMPLRAPAERSQEPPGSVSRLRTRESRCAINSFMMRRLIDLLVAAGSRHHQPSSLHRLRGRHETVCDRLEILVSVIQAEDQAAGPDPAQGQPLGAQVVLQHPIVARGLGVADRPYRRHVGHLHRQAPHRAGEPLSCRARSFQTRSRSRYVSRIGGVARRCRNCCIAPIT